MYVNDSTPMHMIVCGASISAPPPSSSHVCGVVIDDGWVREVRWRVVEEYSKANPALVSMGLQTIPDPFGTFWTRVEYSFAVRLTRADQC